MLNFGRPIVKRTPKPSQFEAEQKLEDTVNNKTRLFYQLTYGRSHTQPCAMRQHPDGLHGGGERSPDAKPRAVRGPGLQFGTPAAVATR